MGAPAERADDVTELRHRIERGIQNRAAHGVVDHIEPAAGGVPGNVVGDRRVLVIDEYSAKLFDIVSVPGRAGCE